MEDGDEVWILGDLIMGNLTHNLTESVLKLKGRKILVPGNHDICWYGHKKGGRQHAKYQDYGGIARIVDAPKPIRLANKPVRLSHFPYKLDPKYDQRYEMWRPENDGSWLLHGHIHEKWKQKDKQINVGVDAWDFTPASDEDLVELIMAGPNDIPCPDYHLVIPS